MTDRTVQLADRTPSTADTIIEKFSASAPRGSWPAEEFAAALRLKGQPAEVVMHLPTDTFHVIVKKVA